MLHSSIKSSFKYGMRKIDLNPYEHFPLDSTNKSASLASLANHSAYGVNWFETPHSPHLGVDLTSWLPQWMNNVAQPVLDNQGR